MTSVSYITTCKGRLSHLKETLPLVMHHSPAEVIVVDYDCPEDSGGWVAQHFPQVKVVRAEKNAGWCLPRARNLGAAAAEGEFLCFFDADIMFLSGWPGWMRHNLQDGFHYRAANEDSGIRNLETWGTFIVPAAAFREVGGYDEAFTAWGGEDDDLYERLRLKGISEKKFPHFLLAALPHNEKSRVLYASATSVKNSHVINQIYRRAKRTLGTMFFPDSELPLAARVQLFRHVAEKVERYFEGGTENDLRVETTLSLPFKVPQTGVEIKQTVAITYELERDEDNEISCPR